MASLSRSLTIAAAVLSLAACNKPGASAVTTDDMSEGNAAAKVTMVEYASVACPHCAVFNNTIFPEFKKKYVDTGRVHYVFREMLVGGTSEVQLAAAGFLLARCAGKDKYFPVVDQTFKAQDDIYKSGDMRGGLLKIAQSAGMSEKQFTDCVSDTNALNALKGRVDKAEKDGVDSTPTFIINGTKLVGEQSMATLDTAVAAAEKK